MKVSFDPRETGKRVLTLFQGADKAVIVAPFITRGGLEPVLDVLNPSGEMTVYTRWRPDEVASGVSDPRVYDLLRSRQGRCAVRLHHLLHAKLYLRPGGRALVGSANTTVTGLGWRRRGGLELLVDATADDPAVVALLNLLDAVSPTATEEVRDQVLEQAEHFSRSPPASEPEATGGQDLSAWLPQYLMPRALWQVYIGNRSEEVTRLAEPDLKALAVPSGLSESQFNAYVRGVLLQSLPGLLAQQLQHLSTYQAIGELENIADTLGLELKDPENAWKALTAWLAYFFPERYSLRPGGRTLSG